MGLGRKPAINWLKQLSIPVRWMPLRLDMLSAVRSFLQFLEEGQPDIYVPVDNVPAFYAAGYARRGGIPTVGPLMSDHPYTYAFVDEFVNGDRDFRLSAVVPCSTFVESQVSTTATALGVTVRRIACGVPIPARTAELSGSVFRLVYIGRLAEEGKRISDLTNAFCTVIQSIPSLEAWIAGEGEARPAVKNIIRKKGISAQVRFLGRVDSAYDVMTRCHSLVLLSDFEGLPISMLEGMATGLVPICLDLRSGVREAIEHGVNGLIVKDRGADFLAAVSGLQSDPAKWQRLSLAARETARKRYAIEESARQWLDLLEHLNRQGAAPPADFQAPRVLRLPPHAESYIHIKPPWKSALEKNLRHIPPLYRMAKTTAAIGRTIKSQADGLI